jgi:hypothetical protein
MELSKSSKSSISTYIIKRGSFGLFNILDTQEILNYEVEDMAKAAYSMFSGIIIIGKC